MPSQNEQLVITVPHNGNACRALAIANKEGLQVNESTIKELCRLSHCDVRLVLGQLQMVRVRTRALSYDDVKV